MREALALLPLAVAAVPACGGGGAGGPVAVEVSVRHSRFSPATLTVPAGRVVRVRLVNHDPIDHEWIVGDDGVHERHRTGTEPRHDTRPTEVTMDALAERVTTVTFAEPGTLRFVCHLPGHEAYGMTGALVVSGA